MKKIRLLSVLLSLALVVGLIPGMSLAVNAETKTVDTLAELTQALNSAGTGTEIIVSKAIELPDGTDLDGHGATIRVETPYLNTGGLRENDPSKYGVFTVSNGSTVTLKNMTVMGGAGDENAAIINKGTLTITDVTMTQSNRGLVNSGIVIMKQCSLSRNAAEYGAGLLNTSTGKIVMDGCSFSNNLGIDADRNWGGGGAAENQGLMYLNNTVMSNNANDECGSAINNYGGTLYIMNSTITGNTAVGDYNTGALRQSNVYVLNSIITDNKYIADNGTEVAESDINDGGYIYYSVIGQKRNDTTTYLCIEDDVIAENVFASYYSAGFYVPKTEKQLTESFSRSVLTKKGRLLYAPLKANSKAAAGGTDTYLDYSISEDGLIVRMSYLDNGSIVALGNLEAADISKKVTTYIEGGARGNGVIGASGIVDSSFYTISLVPDTYNGSVEGVSVYGDSYAAGTSVTLKATPDSGYILEKWILKSKTGTIEVTRNPYIFNINSDMTVQPVFKEGSKEDPTVTAPIGKRLPYTGSAQTLVDAGETTGGTLQYAIGSDGVTAPTEDSWGATIPEGTVVGTYYVWYRVIGNENFNDTEPKCVNAEIYQDTTPTPAKTATITFDTDGGSPIDAITADVGSAITKPADPTKEGYTFAGWEPEFPDTMPENGLTLKAKWTPDADHATYEDLTDDEKLDADKLAKEYGIEKDTATKLLKTGQEYGASIDTMLLSSDAIAKLPNDKDPKGTSFAKLTARAVKRGKTTMRLQWKTLPQADGYLIYANKCGLKYRYKLAKTVKSGKTNKWYRKKLKKQTYYKYLVVAYKNVAGQKLPIAASVTVHCTTKAKKNTIAKAVKLKKTSLTIAKGKTVTLKGKEVKMEAKKIIKKHRGVNYESLNPKIAKVNKKTGKITGVSAGKTTIYVYCQNGVYKKVSVTVK